jgi:hypothetical protein
VSITDGPFAETKEQIGGILLLDTRNLDHATELMSKHPGIRVATFEMRPIDEQSTENINTSEPRTEKQPEQSRTANPQKKEMRLCPSNPI